MSSDEYGKSVEDENPDAAQGKPHVLLIDDDLALGTGLVMALGIDGYEVRHAAGGVEALRGIEGGLQPDVIILDVMMPDMDGWEVLERLRRNPATAQIPVIMLTAKDSTESKIHGFELGTDDYLTKPFAIKELRCRLKALIRRTSSGLTADVPTIPVMGAGGGHEMISVRDIYYIEGIRNYTYVHTYDRRYLCNATLGAIEERGLPPLSRIHRSYIVNLDKVAWCGWANRSAFRVRLADGAATELPASRNLAVDVKRKLGLK